MTIKAKSATANDELVSLKQQVSDLVAVVKANHVQGNPKGTTQQNGQKMEIKQTDEPKYLGELISSLILLDHQKLINQCDNAIVDWDWATWQECATPLTTSRGKFQHPFPPKSRDQREQEAQQTQLKQTPLSPK